ncbi:MAG: hypothetical protein KA419_04570 [Acidobacteria bacterium]|nr:hypothetical protein [Acidobacteriota bacterium]
MRKHPQSRFTPGALAAALALLAAGGCIGIRPLPRPALQQGFLQRSDFWTGTAESGGVTLRARVLASAADSLAVFDADLPSAGILPVFVGLRTTSSAPLSWQNARFTLQPGGKPVSPVPFERVQKRLLKRYGVRMYSDAEIEAFRTAFSALQLPEGPLDAGREAWGVLYFPIREPKDLDRELTLGFLGFLGGAEPVRITLRCPAEAPTDL